MMIEKTFPITEKLIFDALQLTQELYQQLDLEADALKKTHNSESIIKIAANKKQLVAKLELFNSQLGQVLATETLSNSQQGLTDYFNRAKAANFSTEEAIKNWTSIRAISTSSKVLNEQNGAGLDLLARHTKRSLQILKGKAQFANTYGPDGAAKNDTYTRTLSMA
jgi:flagella synthesis protein FlgN